MEASIREANIKHFVRMLQCGSRYGDELCMLANAERWELSVTNSSNTAYSRITLRPSFFSQYRPLGNKAARQRGISCKLHVKSLLSVLGKASAVNSVDRVDLKVVDPEHRLRVQSQPVEENRSDEEDDEDDVRVNLLSAYLEVKLVYRHGVIKKHHLHIQDDAYRRVDVDQDTTPSGFLISAKVLRDWLDHFTIAFGSGVGGNVRGDSHLAWMFTDHEVRAKNFENASTSALSTEIKIDVKEFQDYGIDAERVDFSLPMREFKATLQLAEQFNMDLDFMFSEPGQPMTMSTRYISINDDGSDSEKFDIFCVLATASTDAFSQTGTNGTASRSESRQRSASTTVGDRGGSNRRRSESVRSSTARAGSARPRSTLSFTTGAATQGDRMVTVAGGLGAFLSQASQGTNKEPLFQPGPSQSSQGVRMTQQEVLELAGMGDLDMDALMDEDDDDMDEDAAPAPSMSEPTIPDWEAINTDFEDLPAQNMSTQQDVIFAAQREGSSTTKALADRRSSSPEETVQADKRPAEGSSQLSSITAATIKRTESSAEFKPNPDIFEISAPGGTEPEQREDNTGDAGGEDEVFDSGDEGLGPTQQSGDNFQYFFND